MSSLGGTGTAWDRGRRLGSAEPFNLGSLQHGGGRQGEGDEELHGCLARELLPARLQGRRERAHEYFAGRGARMGKEMPC